MNAEIGIDEEGRAYVALTGMTRTDWAMARYMRAFLPISISETSDDVRIVGDRLPGSGKADR